MFLLFPRFNKADTYLFNFCGRKPLLDKFYNDCKSFFWLHIEPPTDMV